jgi:hypothetical protein
MIRAKTVLAVVLVAALAWVQSVGAQAIKLVPANALVVVKVADLEVTSKKVADFCGTLGLVQMNPKLADPLGMVLEQMGVSAGVNKGGDLAAAMVDPDAAGGNPDQSVIVLFPVSDYQAFLGNFPGNTTQDNVTQVQFKNDVNPSFVAHWGDYAAISPSRTLVATQPTSFITLGDLASKEMDVKDFVVYANVKLLRPKAQAALENWRTMAMAQIDKAAQNPTPAGTNVNVAKVSPVLKVIANQLITLAEEFSNDVDDASFSTNLSPDGIGSTGLLEFAPGSKLGTMVAQGKNTDASLLSGIPDGKYLLFGGGVSNPAVTSQFVNDFLSPIEKAITDLGPDYAPFLDMISAAKTTIATQTGIRFAMIAPTGPLGQEPLFQFMTTRTGGSKTLLAATHQMYDSWQAAMKTLGVPQTGTTTTVTTAAKTLDGVSFDLFQTSFDASQNPQAAQAMQFMTFIYGPNGMQQYIGPVNDDSLLGVSGMSDTSISGAIAAIKSGGDPLANTATVKAVAAELPTERQAVVYIPLDLWASTGLNYAKQFSMDMGVKIPEDLPPVGITTETQGSAVRFDAYVPAQLIQALTSAGMQIYMASHQAAPGSTPGGL